MKQDTVTIEYVGYNTVGFESKDKNLFLKVNHIAVNPYPTGSKSDLCLPPVSS